MASPEYLAKKQAYIKKFNKSHYKAMSLCFRTDNPEEMAMYDFLHSKYSMTQFVKDLVKNAMKNEGK